MKRKELMPEPGSDAHRVFVELARHDGPVEEHVLMGLHGLDGRPPTVWRQGPYKSLATAALIVRVQRNAWQLTKLGRAVMDEVEADIVGRDNGALVPIRSTAAPSTVTPGQAAPRSPVPFKPLSRHGMQLPIRDGAYDYRDIPSLHTASASEKEPS